MPQLALWNMEGEQVGDVEVGDALFDEPLNRDLLHQAVVTIESRRKRHAGKSKKRSEVITSGAKIWPQKGLGRARHSDRGAPLFVGGAKAHPARPRSGNKRMPKKMRRKALACALSAMRRDHGVTVIDSIECDRPRTKTIVRMLEDLALDDRRVLLMLTEDEMADENIVLSCRNVPNLHLRQSPHLNARDVLWAEEIAFTQAALDDLTAMFEAGMSKEGASEEVTQNA
jgi:large subunit ribosomal protein L4